MTRAENEEDCLLLESENDEKDSSSSKNKNEELAK